MKVPANPRIFEQLCSSAITSVRGEGTVLIADDEESICSVGKQMLERMGFKLLVAVDGREAVDIYRAHAEEVVCVLLDLTMPHVNGNEAFREMRRIKPDVAVILCSGYSEHDATETFRLCLRNCVRPGLCH